VTRRKPMSVGVKLRACLWHFMGVRYEDVQFDHDPCLGIRTWDEEAGDYTLPANDWRFITPRLIADHEIKTRGAGGSTAGSDVARAAKVKRLERATARRQHELTRPERSERPRRKIASRPFNRRKK
jgi:hypothetical protein